MIASLFGDDSLFPEEIIHPDNQELIVQELVQAFNHPVPMQVVIHLAQSKPDLAVNFYEEACLIFAADGTVAAEEREFLNDLAEEFGMSRIDKKRIEKRYLQHL